MNKDQDSMLVFKVCTVAALKKALEPLKEDALVYVDMGKIKILTPEGYQSGYLDLLNTQYVGKPARGIMEEAE